jgi:hypothetical protein
MSFGARSAYAWRNAAYLFVSPLGVPPNACASWPERPASSRQFDAEAIPETFGVVVEPDAVVVVVVVCARPASSSWSSSSSRSCCRRRRSRRPRGRARLRSGR